MESAKSFVMNPNMPIARARVPVLGPGPIAATKITATTSSGTHLTSNMNKREIKYTNLPGAVLLAARKEKGIANNKAIPVAAKPIAIVSIMSLKSRSVNHDQSLGVSRAIKLGSF